jgi:hypothetical protein
MKQIPQDVSPAVRKLNPHLYGGKTLYEIFREEEHTIRPIEPDLTLKPCTDEQKLNKTERDYLRHLRMLLPKDAYIGIQNITLKLADDCRFTADFSYIDCSGRMTFVDTKAKHGKKVHIEDDALVKIKVAARTFRWARFVIAYKENDQWTEREVKP